MISRITYRLIGSCLLFGVASMAPTVALAEESAATEPEVVAAEPQNPEPVLPDKFISDGTPVDVESLGITIAPPLGWEVFTATGGLSLIMEEKKEIEKGKKKDYSKPTYVRNITVAAIHHSSPIDEKRAVELKEQLVKNFSEDSLISDFEVLEHKFFNYRGTNDGLLIYSSMKVSEFPMMQMHVLVSGQEKQFLLSYTDLAETFQNQESPSFEAAWASIVSIDVTGKTPLRFEEYIRWGAIAAGILAFFGVIGLIRRKNTNIDYGSEADSLLSEYGDSEAAVGDTSLIATLAGQWRLDTDDELDRDIMFDDHAPKTREVASLG